MIEGKVVFFVYQKDFSENGKDRYFTFEDGKFSEVDLVYLVSLDCFLVTHDFWLISNSIYKNAQSLPSKVVDVVLLAKIVAGEKSVGGDIQPWDISKTIKPLFADAEDFNRYMEIYYRRKEFDFDSYMLFSHKLAEYFEKLSKQSVDANESARFYSLEVPLYNLITLAACRGIRVNNETVRKHKESLQLDFYRELKFFSEKHNVLYELPNDGSIREKLAELGYNIQDYSLDFLIDFLPSKDSYTSDLRSLQKTNKSYRVFNSISISANRLYPIVESHWTSTSRIYHKSPSIQNIAKKYRDIFIPDDGKSLCYVDYDQFEVGVMADISSDPKMAEIYKNSDAYLDLAINVFNDEGMRKKAKIIFLSYTYGMSIENIINSVNQLGGDEKYARDYFSEFTMFESWKASIWREFADEGRVGTIEGNYLNRKSGGVLTEKEKRTAVNHVIQGTATYIFKRALLELSKFEGVDVLIPMHDAVLIQHNDQFEPEKAKTIFENVMSDMLPSVPGKASLEDFYASGQ